MGYGIQDFYSAVQSYGLARNNVFRVKQITNDVFLPDEGSDLYVYAKEGSIPSRNIAAGKVSFKSFDFNVPLNAYYPENQGWNVTFYSDRFYIIRSLLERWSKGTFNEHGHVSTFAFGDCDVEIALIENDSSIEGDINSQSRERVVYNLRGCYPTSIGSISYNATSSGEVVSVTATLAFQYMESLNKNIGTDS